PRLRRALAAPRAPPPRCPYTTLFRSALGAVGGLASVVGAATRERPTDQRIRLGELTLFVRADPWRLSLLGPAGETQRQAPWIGTDRKSTRLNSSHVKISYAVFCLKKK